MSTITKEWLQQKIADMEAARDEIPFGLGEDDSNTLAALRIALASLEAEPVAWRHFQKTPTYVGYWILNDYKPNCSGVEPLYTAPPAPVSVMDEAQSRELFEKNCMANIERNKWHPDLYAHLPAREQWAAWEACRAAMLQSFGNSEQLNSPVIPYGWALVPIEPTEDMIVNGFESEPDESFSDEKEWEAYDAMSGCQQAAHRAKLCWAAMIAAAPKLE